MTKLELQIMEALWSLGASSIREVQEAFPAKGRPAYTTIQTTVYRMEGKGAVRRVKKISNAHIFEACVSRNAAQGRLIDELLVSCPNGSCNKSWGVCGAGALSKASDAG